MKVNDRKGGLKYCFKLKFLYLFNIRIAENGWELWVVQVWVNYRVLTSKQTNINYVALSRTQAHNSCHSKPHSRYNRYFCNCIQNCIATWGMHLVN